MRCDVNISVRKNESDPLGTKIELKNMNSTSAVRRAIHYEVARQCEALDNGESLVQATWRWGRGPRRNPRNANQGRCSRTIDTSPTPDLLPVETAAYIEKVRPLVPELPHEKSARFQKELGLTPYDASVITSDIQLVSYFETTITLAKTPGKKVANWIINNFLGLLNEKSVEIQASPVTPAKLSDILKTSSRLVLVSNSQAKDLFAALWSTPEKRSCCFGQGNGV